MEPNCSAVTSANLPPASPSPRFPPSHSQKGVLAPPITTTSSLIVNAELTPVQEADYPGRIAGFSIKFNRRQTSNPSNQVGLLQHLTRCHAEVVAILLDWK